MQSRRGEEKHLGLSFPSVLLVRVQSEKQLCYRNSASYDVKAGQTVSVKLLSVSTSGT